MFDDAPSSRAAEGTTTAGRQPRERLRARRFTAGGATRQITRFALGIGEGREPAAAVRRDAGLRRALVLADVLAAALALFLAVNLASDDRLLPPVLLVLPLVVVASWLMGLYDRDEIVLSKTTLNEGPALFQLATLHALLVYIAQDVAIQGELGPAQGVSLWLAFLAATFGCRTLIRQAAVRQAEPERCLLLADADRVERTVEKLRHGWALKVDVVRCILASELEHATDARPRLIAAVRRHEVQRVIVATGDLDEERLLEIVRDMKALGVKVSLQPRLLDVVGSAVEFEDVHGDVFLSVRRFGLTRAQQRAKRLMDLAGAGLVLLVASPVLVAIAVALKLDSRGPVFFRQERVGRDGRRFTIWKFRTMHVDAEERKDELAPHNEAGGGLFKIADDPRVTRVGGFLRQTSLDELPQLLNVLRGEMSLVGPRPLVVEEDSRIQGWHRRRLHLTPGMTGGWQVLGSARIPLQDMVALDYLYIVNWSLWRDVQILLRTVAFVFGRRGM